MSQRNKLKNKLKKWKIKLRNHIKKGFAWNGEKKQQRTSEKHPVNILYLEYNVELWDIILQIRGFTEETEQRFKNWTNVFCRLRSSHCWLIHIHTKEGSDKFWLQKEKTQTKQKEGCSRLTNKAVRVQNGSVDEFKQYFPRRTLQCAITISNVWNQLLS